MKTLFLLAISGLIALLSEPRVYAGVIEDLIYVNETGTAFYISNSETNCRNLRNIGRAYMCDLHVDTTGGVSTVNFFGNLARTYGVNPGNILVNESDKSGPSDLIQFSGSVDDGHNRKLADTIKFYSLGDDKDTDKSIDTTDKSIFNVKTDGSCQLFFTTGKTCSIEEADLSAESDTVNGTDLEFDGKSEYKQKDGTIITLPSLVGASGIAFTSVKDRIGGLPNYPDRVLRYVFVSDTGCEPKAPAPKNEVNSSDACPAPTPEPRSIIPLGASLITLLWLSRRRRTFFHGIFAFLRAISCFCQ
jgi:hypothetical protein